MELYNLKPPAGSTHKRKRVGRGPGSGHGKTATRGSKGQKSRSGYSARRGFEWCQMPLHRRIPKRGFTNIFQKQFAVVNIADIVKLEETTITPEVLHREGLIRNLKDSVKILGTGDVTKPLTVRAHAFSGSAKEKITNAQGSAEIIQ